MKDKIIGLKREVVGIDEPSVCATIAYGYSNKKEAAKIMTEYSGESYADVFGRIEKVRVRRYEKDGEWYYSWAEKCKECGSKNDGIISFIDEC